MNELARRIARIDAHHRFFAGIAFALLGFVLAHGRSWSMRGLVAWDTFAFVSLALSWTCIVFGEAKAGTQAARLQDSSRTAIFFFVVAAACASLVAVGILLGPAKGLSGTALAKHIALAAVTVILSWGITHTVFTLHYAHIFHNADDSGHRAKQGDGLEFPGKEQPGFMDFAYFSFVVGMTCQVSDVQVTSQRIRRLVLMHGVLSFAFNTIILALTVNLGSTVL
jgi:uncharacterized membrane protein